MAFSSFLASSNKLMNAMPIQMGRIENTVTRWQKKSIEIPTPHPRQNKAGGTKAY